VEDDAWDRDGAGGPVDDASQLVFFSFDQAREGVAWDPMHDEACFFTLGKATLEKSAFSPLGSE
jgi:hypothetical protein